MEKFSFFNSVNGDRRYKAEDWANYFNKFITNGYFPNIASNLQVIASGTNMKVTLRAGAAWINGYMYNNTTDFDLTIQTADAVNSRKDRVVIRLDHSKREVKAYVKKGTPSTSPVAPALQRDADAYELSVAEVLVRNGVVVITQEAVTDVRLNKDLCGVVNSLLQADTTAIFNQYLDWFTRTKANYDQDNSIIMSDLRKSVEDEKKRYNTEFTAWFQNLKAVLDTNTAGNLLNEINKINDKWNSMLVELDKKSQAVQHGLNVVNTPVSSPLGIEIQGHTLENLLGKDGAVSQTNKVYTINSSKYYLIINSSGAQVTVDSTAQNTPYKFTGKSSVKLTWTTGMVALYEVDQATYNKINVDAEFSGSKLISKFPYVEGVQHLNPVVNIVGTNPSYLYTNILLAGQNGVNDVLYQEDGQWKVLRKWSIDKNTKAFSLLSQSIVETVQVEGDLVASGTAQVTIDSGVVVREKATPIKTVDYYINRTDKGPSKLKNKTSRVLFLYKNGLLETKWAKVSTNAYGNEAIVIKESDFDPTAEYTVTYLVLDKHLFTTNVIDAKVTYNQSLASTVREVGEKQADNSTLLFAQQAQMSELVAKTREYGLRLTPRRSGKDENDIYTIMEYKMANGTVRLRSVLSNPNAYGSYLIKTETTYFENGTVAGVTVSDLIYDADENFIDEVERI